MSLNIEKSNGTKESGVTHIAETDTKDCKKYIAEEIVVVALGEERTFDVKLYDLHRIGLFEPFLSQSTEKKVRIHIPYNMQLFLVLVKELRLAHKVKKLDSTDCMSYLLNGERIINGTNIDTSTPVVNYDIFGKSIDIFGKSIDVSEMRKQVRDHVIYPRFQMRHRDVLRRDGGSLDEYNMMLDYLCVDS